MKRSLAENFCWMQNLLKCKDDPDTAVAMGACNFAASLWLPYEPNVPKMILIETCPYNIGIGTIEMPT